MIIYPCLSTGAIAQFPILQTAVHRTVRSTLQDGTQISWPDLPARSMKWAIPYRGLSDTEVRTLTDFFLSTQGSLQPFLFLDPTANLLAFSEDFSNAVWSVQGVSMEQGVSDPLGGLRAVRVHNYTADYAGVAQSTAIPGIAQTCFSVYLRSGAGASALLTRTAGNASQSARVPVDHTWRRFTITSTLSSVESTSSFAVTGPPGSAIEVFGPQVDAQGGPSPYITSGAGSGIYSNAHFDMDAIHVEATGPNRNSCDVTIRCARPSGGNQ